MKKLTILLSTLLFLSSCSNNSGNGDGSDKGVTIGNGRGEKYLFMEADLSKAVKITANIPQDPKKEPKRLLKMTTDDKFEQILNGDYKMFSYKITPTHIIAHVDIWENDKHCSLIAIPKVQGKTPVLCINRELVSCSSPDESRGYIGYDIQGVNVFFSYQNPLLSNGNMICNPNGALKVGSPGASYSELRSWDGVTEKVETHFRSEPTTTPGAQLLIRDVFVSTKNKSICVDTDNGGSTPLLCKKEGENKWIAIEHFNDLGGAPFFKLKNQVLASAASNKGIGKKLDIDTFTVSERTGLLPKRRDFNLENGGAIGLNTVHILKINPDANSETVLELDFPNINPARVGNWGWYTGGNSLRRFDLTDGTLDTKDFYTETTLLRLTGLFWSPQNLLRVDGTSTEGMPASSYIDMQGNLVHVSFPPVNVENPIELKWEH